MKLFCSANKAGESVCLEYVESNWHICSIATDFGLFCDRN